MKPQLSGSCGFGFVPTLHFRLLVAVLWFAFGLLAPQVHAQCNLNGNKSGAEACDDGNSSNGDGCSSSCTIESGYTCTGANGSTSCCQRCGNGIMLCTEGCDDGNTTAGDGCSATCSVEPGYTCTGTTPTTCMLDGSVCPPTGNLCSPKNGTTAGCEQCDDGDGNDTNQCTNQCRINLSWSPPGCGNGTLAGSEACDDGNNTNGDGCSSTCTAEAGYNCAGNCCRLTASCGNGAVNTCEACDDANTSNGDGCSNACAVESGYTCTGTPSSCSVPSTCGNGAINGSEGCDDGNTTNGDGCTSTCAVQAGYTCSGTPSVCTLSCGNGTRSPATEACDDGNTANGDGCSSTCTIESGFTCTNNASATPNTSCTAVAGTVCLSLSTSLPCSLAPEHTTGSGTSEAFAPKSSALPNFALNPSGSSATWADLAPGSASSASAAGTSVLVASGSNYTFSTANQSAVPDMMLTINTSGTVTINDATTAAGTPAQSYINTLSDITIDNAKLCCPNCTCSPACSSTHSHPEYGAGYAIRTGGDCGVPSGKRFNVIGQVQCASVGVTSSAAGNCLVGDMVGTLSVAEATAAGIGCTEPGGATDEGCSTSGTICLKNNFVMVGDLLSSGNICAKNNPDGKANLKSKNNIAMKNNVTLTGTIEAVGNVNFKNNAIITWDGVQGSEALPIAVAIWVDAAW